MPGGTEMIDISTSQTVAYDKVCAGMEFDEASQIVERTLVLLKNDGMQRPDEDIYNAFRMIFSGSETDRRWNSWLKETDVVVPNDR
jgi:hypothetical protein